MLPNKLTLDVFDTDCFVLLRYHHIYFDNFFSSVDLLLDLLKLGLYGCGTLRSNRKGFPEDLKPLLKKELERGEYKAKQHKQLFLCGKTIAQLS